MTDQFATFTPLGKTRPLQCLVFIQRKPSDSLVRCSTELLSLHKEISRHHEHTSEKPTTALPQMRSGNCTTQETTSTFARGATTFARAPLTSRRHRRFAPRSKLRPFPLARSPPALALCVLVRTFVHRRLHCPRFPFGVHALAVLKLVHSPRSPRCVRDSNRQPTSQRVSTSGCLPSYKTRVSTNDCVACARASFPIPRCALRCTWFVSEKTHPTSHSARVQFRAQLQARTLRGQLLCGRHPSWRRMLLVHTLLILCANVKPPVTAEFTARFALASPSNVATISATVWRAYSPQSKKHPRRLGIAEPTLATTKVQAWLLPLQISLRRPRPAAIPLAAQSVCKHWVCSAYSLFVATVTRVLPPGALRRPCPNFGPLPLAVPIHLYRLQRAVQA